MTWSITCVSAVTSLVSAANLLSTNGQPRTYCYTCFNTSSSARNSIRRVTSSLLLCCVIIAMWYAQCWAQPCPPAGPFLDTWTRGMVDPPAGPVLDTRHMDTWRGRSAGWTSPRHVDTWRGRSAGWTSPGHVDTWRGRSAGWTSPRHMDMWCGRDRGCVAGTLEVPVVVCIELSWQVACVQSDWSSLVYVCPEWQFVLVLHCHSIAVVLVNCISRVRKKTPPSP